MHSIPTSDVYKTVYADKKLRDLNNIFRPQLFEGYVYLFKYFIMG